MKHRAFKPWDGRSFNGAKGALVYGDRLVVLRRDDLPGLPWAGLIDLPGGGRDGQERPVDTLLREVQEEVGLVLMENRVQAGWPRRNRHGKTVWFFVCPITFDETQTLRLGNEGQACWMMPIGDFLTADDAIGPLQESVREAGL